MVIGQTERKKSASPKEKMSNTHWRTSMGRPANGTPRTVVEDCEILKVTSTSTCVGLGFHFDTVPTRGRGRRLCLFCPLCQRRAFKLYRPSHLPTFACRSCHNLSYTSVQKHDARLDQLLKAPDSTLMRLMSKGQKTWWRLLAARAGYIRLGLMSKY